MKSTRTSWQVTRSVWHALLMREALARTTGNRMAWFWMLFEPAAMIAIMVAIRSVAGGSNIRTSGAEFVPWLICGLFGFFLFRENMMRSIGAVNANKALFAYRQVLPIDPVIIRCFVEGMLKSVIFVMFIMIGELMGANLFPSNILYALEAWLALWLLGLGAGLSLSASSTLIPEIGKIVQLTSLPLLLMSGVMFPLNFLPYEIQQYLLLNPIVHGLETLRTAFFPLYRSLNGISITYLWLWALSLATFGLMLHLKFAIRFRAL